MNTYHFLKTLHVACVAISGTGFVLRGYWMFSGNPLLRHTLVRALPHVVDTLLLGSAIALALLIHQFPFVNGWVTAKVCGLAVYIVLGTVALRRGRNRTVRSVAFFAALLIYAWIVSVALTKNPWGYLAH